MSVIDQSIQTEVKESIQGLVKSDVLLAGSQAAEKALAGVTVQSDEDAAAAGDMRLAIRKATRHVDDGLTEVFRPRKMFEKLLREHFKTVTTRFDEATKRIDHALLAWSAEKQRRADLAREEQERAAREAAEAARAEAEAAAAEEARLVAEAKAAHEAALAALRDGADPDTQAAADAAAQAANAALESLDAPEDEAPPDEVAQVYVPEPEKRVRSATTTTFERRTLKASLEDPKLAIKAWPQAYEFSETLAAKAFKEFDSINTIPAEGKVIGGVRFYVEVSISGRAR